MKKYIYIVDTKEQTNFIMNNPSNKDITRLFFLNQNVTIDYYVLNENDIELLMVEDDHKNDNEKHFYYKNGPSDSCINYVCGRVVLIGTDKAKIMELIEDSIKYENMYKEMYKEVNNA